MERVRERSSARIVVLFMRYRRSGHFGLDVDSGTNNIRKAGHMHVVVFYSFEWVLGLRRLIAIWEPPSYNGGLPPTAFDLHANLHPVAP